VPFAAPKPCTHPGCGILVKNGSRCPAHERPKYGWRDDRARGTKAERYGKNWPKTRLRIIRRDMGLCQNCLRNGFAVAGRICDHIIPKFRGGSDDDSNLEFVCQSCSDAKTIRERTAP
jgi:5-methylcytosine-specific restriction enzyme A